MMFFFAAAMAMLAPPPEHFAMAMQPGFIVGHRQTAQNGSIEERIPKGETVDDWSRMVTIITLNDDTDARTYATAFSLDVMNACQGAWSDPRMPVTVAGLAAIDSRIDCPLNPSTGKPETFFFRVLSAGGRLHMLQVAFRHAPSAVETAWAKAQIAGATWCADGSAEAICKA